MQCLTEKTYVGDDFAFSVTDTPDGFFIAMCSRQEYDEGPNPIFHFVGIKQKADGWTLEKIEKLLDDKEFLFDSAMMAMSQASESAKITKASQEQRQERLLKEVKDEIKNVAEVSSQTCWTLEEASKYSKIGINRLRTESGKKDCPWVLWIADTKRVVKVDAFKKWLDDIRRVE